MPNNKIMVPRTVSRADSLGQLDREFNHGPQPIHPRDVPIDLRERYIFGESTSSHTLPICLVYYVFALLCNGIKCNVATLKECFYGEI